MIEKWLTISLLTYCANSMAVSIDVFGFGVDKALVQETETIHFYAVDMNQQLISVLNARLKKEAERLAHLGQEMSDDDVMAIYLQYEPELKHAFEHLAPALEQQVMRVPAIVFNHGEAVVYGTYDIEGALKQYFQWKRGLQK